MDIPFVLSGQSAASSTHAEYEFPTKRPPDPQTTPVTIMNPCAAASHVLSLPFNYSLPLDPNQHTLTASGELDFCNLKVTYNVKPLSLEAMVSISLQQYSSLVVQGQYSTSIDFTEPLDLSQLESQVKCLGNETCQAVEGLPDSIGNALEVVTPSLTPFVGMTGSASGGLYLGGAESGTFQAGGQLKDVTISPILGGTLQQQAFPTAVDGTADVKGFFGVTLGFQLLGSVTAHVDPRMYAELSANTGTNPWWTLSVGDEALAGITASFLGIGSTEYDTKEFTIFSAPIANAGGPYSGLPTLTLLTPNSAQQGTSGLTLAVTGTNFVPGAKVNFAGSPLSTTYSDPTLLSATLPAGLLAVPGTYSVFVANSSTTPESSNSLPFTVSSLPNPVPTITGLSPASLAAGSATQAIAINGTGFLASSTIQFNGIPHAATFVSSSQLTILVTVANLATAGSYSVIVTNPTPGGGSSNTASFVVTAPVVTVTISPPTAQVIVKGLQQFTATVTNASNTAVTWSVNGVTGGTLVAGTITSGGLYSAPLNVPSPATVTVKATSQEFPSIFGSASVTIGPYNETPVYSFSTLTDGAAPSAPLIQASDGYFYGTAQVGGTYGFGTTFKVDTAGHVTPLHEFSGSDGEYLQGPLFQKSDGTFYGTTLAGGNFSCTAITGLNGCGTVFKMDSSGNVTTLHLFSGSGDGAGPDGGLTLGTDGYLYGTTESGGTYNCGTVFRITVLGSISTLYSFTGGADGLSPDSSLIQGSDGYFYGTTEYGGAICAVGPTSSCGTVFKISPAGSLITLHSFTGGADGANPDAGALMQASDGFFYGTTLFEETPLATYLFTLAAARYSSLARREALPHYMSFPAASKEACPFPLLSKPAMGIFTGQRLRGEILHVLFSRQERITRLIQDVAPSSKWIRPAMLTPSTPSPVALVTIEPLRRFNPRERWLSVWNDTMGRHRCYMQLHKLRWLRHCLQGFGAGRHNRSAFRIPDQGVARRISNP